MAKLEPGGAQLSMLRVMAELRGRGNRLAAVVRVRERGRARARPRARRGAGGLGGRRQSAVDAGPGVCRLARSEAAERGSGPCAHVRRVVGGRARGARGDSAGGQRAQPVPLARSSLQRRDARRARPRRCLLRARSGRPRDRAGARPAAGSAPRRHLAGRRARRTGRVPAFPVRGSSSPVACTPTRAPTSCWQRSGTCVPRR